MPRVRGEAGHRSGVVGVGQEPQNTGPVVSGGDLGFSSGGHSKSLEVLNTRGDRPLVERYLEPGVLFPTMHGRVTAPSC